MNTLRHRARITAPLVALMAFIALAIGTAPDAHAATYKITNHGASGVSITASTGCSSSGISGSFKTLYPGYGTNHYGAGFYVDRKAKVYRNGVYVYTAYGPVTRCVGSGTWKVLVI